MMGVAMSAISQRMCTFGSISAAAKPSRAAESWLPGVNMIWSGCPLTSISPSRWNISLNNRTAPADGRGASYTSPDTHNTSTCSRLISPISHSSALRWYSSKSMPLNRLPICQSEVCSTRIRHPFPAFQTFTHYNCPVQRLNVWKGSTWDC